MNKYYTYIWCDPKDNTVRYIGKGTGNRVNEHIKTDTRLGRMLKKRVREGYNPHPIINYEIDEQQAFDKEIWMISFFGREDLKTGPLFNQTPGGEGAGGRIRYQEERDKISRTNKEKGIAPREEYRGYHLTPEQEARRISALQSGETRKKHSEHSKAIWADPVYKESRTGENAWNYGTTQSQETKDKRIETRQSNGKPWHTEETKAKQRSSNIGKKHIMPPDIKCIHCLKEFDSGNYKQFHGDNCKLNPNGYSPRIQLSYTCVHCNKTGNGSGMLRWHFDNCKFKI